MNKKQYLDTLERLLRRLPPPVRLDIIQDIEAHFQGGLEQGKREEDIAASLGAPQQLAKELLAEHYVEQAQAKSSAENVLGAIWATIGLGFFNIVIVLGPFLTLALLLLSGWMIAFSFLATPVLALVSLFVHPDSFQWFTLFASLALSGAGILIAIGMKFVTRIAFTGFVKYIRYHIKLVRGGTKYE